MKPEFKLPTDDEVRKAYGIPSGQPLRIEKADTLPDPGWMARIGGVLKEAAAYFGVPTFLLTAGGIVVAVYFFPYWGPKVKEEIGQAITVSYDYWIGPFQHLPKPQPEEPVRRFAIVTTTPNTVAQSITFLETGKAPPGTQIFPVSGIRS